jgi:methionyl aminopeptidase
MPVLSPRHRGVSLVHVGGKLNRSFPNKRLGFMLAAHYKKDHPVAEPPHSMTMIETSAIQRRKPGHIRLHDAAAFEGMRKAGRLTAEALDTMVDLVKPGVTTAEIDRAAFTFACDHGAYPATLNYRGYAYSVCTSINHVVCHGMPDDRPLKEGDILNIDITLIVDGWHGDASRMYAVGEVPRRAARLVEVTYESLLRGIAAVRPGGHLGDIGEAIQRYAEAERCSVVRDFCGHGLGQLFHDEPNVLHYGRRGEGLELKPGMFFTIEPMINLGRPHVKILSDGWTAVTRDRSLSAQFEHTVAVTDSGVEIFTLSPKGLDNPLAPRG